MLVRDGIYLGRRKILTSCLPEQLQFPGYIGDTLNEATLPQELSNALSIHILNALEFEELEAYYRGDQPILRREKGDRAVNNKVVVNYAQGFTRDIVGYTYSNGIQYVANNTRFTGDVQTINNFMKSEYKSAITKTMADHQSIGGVAYIGVLPDALEKNDVPFELISLHPTCTEVVYSTYNQNVPVFAWTSYCTKVKGETRHIYQVWTSDTLYLFNSASDNSIRKEDFVSATPHILKEIPIIAYQNNEFLMGDWECAISLMNAINNMASDSVNDVEQTILSYLVLIGVDVEKSDFAQAKKEKLLVLPGLQGVNADAKFLTCQLDGNSANLLRSYMEQALKFVVGIPDRDTGTGGSDTGISAEVRTGSGDLEIVAKNKVQFTEMSERRLLRILLWILSPQYISPDMKVYDIDVEIPRNKLANAQSKAQTGQIMHEMGMALEDIVKVMDLNTDYTGTVKRWRESLKQAQEQAQQQQEQSASTEDIVVEEAG